MAERETEALDEHNRQTRGGDLLRQLLGLITPVVADTPVDGTESMSGGYREQQPAPVRHEASPLLECRHRIGNVLEYLEGADEVEARCRSEHLDAAVEDGPAPELCETLEGYREGRWIRLEARVLVRRREPDAERPLARTDLQDRVHILQAAQDAAYRIVAQPAAEGERRGSDNGRDS